MNLNEVIKRPYSSRVFGQLCVGRKAIFGYMRNDEWTLFYLYVSGVHIVYNLEKYDIGVP